MNKREQQCAVLFILTSLLYFWPCTCLYDLDMRDHLFYDPYLHRPNKAFSQLCSTLYATSRVDGGPSLGHHYFGGRRLISLETPALQLQLAILG